MIERPDGERIAVLETRIAAHQAQIDRLVALEVTMAKWAAAQEERNEIQRQRHDEEREDRWQVWLRWAVTPGLPLAAMILWAWKAINGE